MKCINCNKEIKNKNKYCSIKCQKEHEYKSYIYKWKNGEVNGMRGDYQISMHIKTYMFNKYKNRCARCGWNEFTSFYDKVFKSANL